MARCKHQFGLLTIRECSSETDARCQICGKPICQKHQKDLTGKLSCYECFVEKSPDNLDNDPDYSVRRAHRRSTYYSHAYYTPFYLFHSHDPGYLERDNRYRDVSYGDFDPDNQPSEMDYEDFEMDSDDFGDS